MDTASLNKMAYLMFGGRQGGWRMRMARFLGVSLGDVSGWVSFGDPIGSVRRPHPSRAS